AWCPPTFSPSTLGRTALASWTMRTASHSVRDAIASRTPPSAGAARRPFAAWAVLPLPAASTIRLGAGAPLPPPRAPDASARAPPRARRRRGHEPVELVFDLRERGLEPLRDLAHFALVDDEWRVQADDIAAESVGHARPGVHDDAVAEAGLAHPRADLEGRV